MSIRNRLEDARVLTSAGRREGAFVQVLIAAAATSRKRYNRREWDDNESFKNFIYDEMGVITGGPKYAVAFEFLGKKTPLEDILYQHLRCQLVHEGEMPSSIEFTEPVHENGTAFNTLKLGVPLGFPEGWIERLATAVWLSPENDDLWKDEEERRKAAIEGLGPLWEHHPFSRRPGQQTKAMKANSRGRVVWTHDGHDFATTYPAGLKPSAVADSLEVKAASLRTEAPSKKIDS